MLEKEASVVNARASIKPADWIVETGSSGNNWYRLWNSGWLEQGGIISRSGDDGKGTFVKAFGNTNYILTFTILGSPGTGSRYRHWLSSKSTDSFKVTDHGFSLGASQACYYACGFA